MLKNVKKLTLRNIIKPISEQVLQFCNTLEEPDVCISKPDNVLKVIGDVSFQICKLSASSKGRDTQRTVSHFRKVVMDIINFLKTSKKCIDNSEEKVLLKELFTTLLQSLSKVLQALDNAEVVQIEQEIEQCQKSLLQIQNDALSPQIIIELKEFVLHLSRCVKLLQKRIKDLSCRSHRNSLMLCLSQVRKCMCLLSTALRRERKDHMGLQSKETKRYVLGCIHTCLEEIKFVLNQDLPEDEKEVLDFGHFVHGMDSVLDYLATFCDKPDVLDIIQTQTEAILCQAMSLAHVAISTDSQAISASCQKTLREFQTLKTVVEKNAVEMLQLQVQILSDALTTLEKNVNTSLLRLVVQVFADPAAPLRQLVSMCTDDATLKKRCREDLKEMIASYDLQMDRIMQIGMFAIACSSDEQRVLGIKCCLASLESLEPELVPSLVAYYLDPKSSANKSHFQFLYNHWKQEIKNLQSFLEQVIDPAAFAQVTHEEAYKIVASLKAKLFNQSEESTRNVVLSVVNRAKRLMSLITYSVEQMENDNDALLLLEKDLKFATEECLAAISISPEQVEPLKARRRVLERCELMVSVLKKIEQKLIEDTILEEEAQSLEVNVTFCQDAVKKEGESYIKLEKLNFPDSISDLPIDEPTLESPVIDNQNSSSGHHETVFMNTYNTPKSQDHIEEVIENNAYDLTPYITKSKAYISGRSILYKTPNRTVNKQLLVDVSEDKSSADNPEDTLKSVDMEPDSVSSCSETSTVNSSMGLQVTAILEELTSLSNTLLSSCSVGGESALKARAENNSMEEERSFSAETKEMPCNEGNRSEIRLGDKSRYRRCNGTSPCNMSLPSIGSGIWGSTLRTLSNFSLSSASNCIYTPERLMDIEVVKDRIRNLKTQEAITE